MTSSPDNSANIVASWDIPTIGPGPYPETVDRRKLPMRKAVGLVILHPTDDRILIGRRRLEPNQSSHEHWQMPQGGIDEGETFMAAAWRELSEETGITSTDVTFLDVLPNITEYEYTDWIYKDTKFFRGQVHVWVVFRKKTPDLPDPEQAKDKEFESFDWTENPTLPVRCTALRRKVYKQVAEMLLNQRFMLLLQGVGALVRFPDYRHVERLMMGHLAGKPLDDEIHWQFPQATLKAEETLPEAAERVLKEGFGPRAETFRPVGQLKRQTTSWAAWPFLRDGVWYAGVQRTWVIYDAPHYHLPEPMDAPNLPFDRFRWTDPTTIRLLCHDVGQTVYAAAMDTLQRHDITWY